MDKKFEKLMDLIINENEEQANELFHEIVVERSREIFESIMAEEMEGMGGEVGDLLDEIEADETGLSEDDEEMDFGMDDMDDDMDSDIEFDDEIDLDSSELEDMEGGDEVEDAVIRIEDKLDQLKAEFDRIMAGDEEDMDMDADMDMGDDMDDEELDLDMNDDFDSEEVMEGVELQKVSVTHGDNGTNKKSPLPQNSGKAGMDSDVVKFSGHTETVPTSPKGPSNIYAKGQKDLPGAGKFKNAPGHKKMDQESAPKAQHGDNGTNTRSPVAESRKARRRIK